MNIRNVLNDPLVWFAFIFGLAFGFFVVWPLLLHRPPSLLFIYFPPFELYVWH